MSKIIAVCGSPESGKTTFALKLESDNLYIVGYAKEGLIKQNIYDKALNKIKSVLENDKASF